MNVYTKLGLGIFETHEKRPKAAGWRDSFPDITAEQSYKEFGVNLTKEYLVIDIDPRNDGVTSFKQLLLDLQLDENFYANTLLVTSPRKGLHIYLKKPENIHVSKGLKKYPGIDFLSEGSYVIGAGSTISHGPYTQVKEFKTIANAPKALLKLLKKEKKEPIVMDEAIVTAKIPESKQLLSSYLKGQIEPITGDRVKSIYKYACRGKDLGLPVEDTLEIITVYNDNLEDPLPESELTSTVESAYKYSKNTMGISAIDNLFEEDIKTFDKTKKKKNFDMDDLSIAKPNIDENNKAVKCFNTLIFYLEKFQLADIFRTNEFTHRVERVGELPWDRINKEDNLARELKNLDLLNIRQFLCRNTNMDFKVPDILNAIEVVSARRGYHPVKDWLNSLVWDGEARLDTWLHRIARTDDNEYTRALSRIVLTAAVARIYRPGTKFDYVLILEGQQGIRKSTLINILGSPWASDCSIDLTNMKEAVQLCQAKWFIEIPEFTVIRKTDADTLKAFITRSEDEVRLPYAPKPEIFPRQFVMIGTINPDDNGYINDPTGNRRYCPVFCHGRIKTELMEQEREQIFAEAKHRYFAGQELYMSDPLVLDFAAKEVAKREQREPWTYIIRDFLENTNKNKINGVEIGLLALGIEAKHIGKKELVRIGRAMAELGWRKTRSHYERPLEAERQYYGYQ